MSSGNILKYFHYDIVHSLQMTPIIFELLHRNALVRLDFLTSEQ